MAETDLMDFYRQALGVLEAQIKPLQEEQKAHFQCKKGCDGCCMDTFRVRYIELLYMMQGFLSAPAAMQHQILVNLQNPALKEQKRCPILIDGACGLYAHRPVLCRGYGLRILLDGGVSTCSLNYQDVTSGEQLKVLDLGAIYDLMNHLSDLAWTQMTGCKNGSPMLTIRQFLEEALANQLKQTRVS